MLRIYKKRERGFTLAEMVVYAALIALLLGVIVQSTLMVVGVQKRSGVYLDINSSAITAFARLSRDIRRATGVDEIASTLGASQGSLVLEMKRPDGTNDITRIYLDEEQVKTEENGVYMGALTPENISISNLTFRLFDIASTTAVRIEMTVAPDPESSVPALNFYSTYVLRGSYIE